MNRRTLLLLLPLAALIAAAAPVPAALSPQDRETVQQIEGYLNSIHTLKAHFVQVAPNGQISQGTAWMQRPGRMRFQYDPPSPILLVAGHGLFVFYDRELHQTSNIALGSTPLGILLADTISFSQGLTVTGFQRLPGQVGVTLVRTASPGDGSLTLYFSTDPLELRQWSVIDAQRRETRVTLFNVQLGGSFDQDMFTLPNQRLLPGQGLQYYK